MKKTIALILVSVLFGSLIFTGCNTKYGDAGKSPTASTNTTAGTSAKSSVSPSATYISTPTPTASAIPSPSLRPDSTQERQDSQNGTGTNNSNSETKKDTYSVTLYYQDAKGCLIPVTVGIPKVEGIAKASLSCLVDNALNREKVEYYGLYPVLPKDTVIQGINIKDGLATVDFNTKVLNYTTQTEERNIIASIVYTLTEFSTIDNVKILVNGYEQGKLKFNTDISGILNRDNIMINSSTANLQSGLDKSDIYVFKEVNDKYTYLVPLSVEHSKVDLQYLPIKIMELYDLDYGKEFTSGIPEGTKLISCSISGDQILLNFNDKLKSYEGGAEKEKQILQQIMHSMKQIANVKKIKILIDGKEATLPEGTQISQFVLLPNEINAFID